MGEFEGSAVGEADGADVGEVEGSTDGAMVGEKVPWLEETCSRETDGSNEGAAVGESVGDMVHVWLLQMASSDVAGHAVATPAPAEVSCRAREWAPPPHGAEQSVHALQELTEQSTHGIVEQAAESDREGHAAPPANSASLTDRDRCELPEVHHASHVVHAPHELTAQSLGHVFSVPTRPVGPVAVAVQESTSVVLEHAMPPAEAGELMVRIRARDPAPHVTEHELHTCHALWEQSLGQTITTQLRVSARAGQEAPPPLSFVPIPRVRLEALVEPQLTGQADHSLHALTAQSTGHRNALHSEYSCVAGQLAPRPT